MRKNTTWRTVGLFTAAKYICLVVFIIFVISVLSSIYLYFNPVYENYSNYLSDSRYMQEAAQSVISAEKGSHIYSAFWCIVWAGISFCGFLYFKKKLVEVKHEAKKTSPEVTKELVNFGKRYNELIQRIGHCTSFEELKSLDGAVCQYNSDAEEFFEVHNISPKLITYSEYDAKFDAMNPKTFDEEMDEKFPLIPKTHGDWTVRFRYRNMLCILKENESDIINTLKDCIGYEVTFVPEPDNEFDSKAVAVHFGGKKVGYIYKSDRAQEMVHTWIKLNRHLCGYISRYDETEGKIYYDIGFYKSD